MEGINNFLRELQRFDIDISKDILIYNSFRSAKLYTVYLQNAYLQFNTDLYAHLKSIHGKEERIQYLKKLKSRFTDIDDLLLQNRDMFVLLESLLIDNAIEDYESIIPRLEEMNVSINTEGASTKQLEEIDLLSFIDSQISYSYKAISLAYNMITLELGVPSSYGNESKGTSYKLRWKSSMYQLAELFVELQKKGWIATIEEDKLEPAVNSIVELFDIARTRVFGDEKEYDSMTKILKGTLGKSGHRQYDQLYTEKYTPAFEGIQERMIVDS